MPVVSQSIIRPMVPVGASTVACELRTPYCSPSSTASSHDCCCGGEQLRRDEFLVDLRGSARCMRNTLSIASSFFA